MTNYYKNFSTFLFMHDLFEVCQTNLLKLEVKMGEHWTDIYSLKIITEPRASIIFLFKFLIRIFVHFYN